METQILSPKNSEKPSSDNFEYLRDFVWDMVQLGRSKDFEDKIFAASSLKFVYNNLLLLKNSKNPLWADPDGQDIVDLWLNLVKEQIELI